MPDKPPFPGAIEDPRTPEQKAKDYPHTEMLGGAPSIVWEEKTDWLKLEKRFQNGSSSCGGQGGAKACEFFTGVPMSAHPTYRWRPNFDGEGMYMQAIGSNLVHKGTTTEALDPSQNMTEAQLNQDVTVPTPFKISGYYFLPSNTATDMNLVAQALEKGHPVIVLVRTTYDEWQAIPEVNTNSTNFWGHFVTCVPKNYLLYNGKKSIVIDDSINISTTINSTGQRILTEDFLKVRGYGLMAIIPVTEVEKPVYTFTRNMREGYRGEDVEALQKVLKYLGYFKVNPTGYFGPVTKKAVMALQLEHKDEILTPAGLTKPTGVVAFYTRKWINTYLTS